jgi:hypothetical protein
MVLSNLQFLLNPRQVELGEMNYGSVPTGTGMWLPPMGTFTLAPGEGRYVPIGAWQDWLDGPFGPGGGGGGGGDYGGETGECSEQDLALFRGMFPSCYWTAQAEVTTLGQEMWDPGLGQYVIGNVTEQWVWQSAGVPVPEPASALLALMAMGLLAPFRRPGRLSAPSTGQ